MLKFILHRALATVPVLFLLSLIVFSLIHLIPGDPVQIMLGEENDPHALQALRRELGLDCPIVEQFLRWLWRLLQGDFGRSLRSHQPVLETIGERLPVTIELTMLAMFISLSIALPAGVISALRRNSVLDVLSTMTALTGVSIPNFFLGILLIVAFAQELQWLPSSGYVSPQESLALNLKTMLLPAVTLGTGLAAIVMPLAEAGLSFLRLGVQPPTPSWGAMLNVGRGYLEIAPWMAMAPGAAIFLTVLGFNFLGDGVRDALDPRLKQPQ